MTVMQLATLPAIALATVALSSIGAATRDAEARWCTLVPGRTIAVVRVERDTMLPFAPADVRPMSASSVPAGSWDSLVATPATPMPAARVRLLQLDSATRAILAGQGIADSQPVAFIRAAPYRPDCRTIRWTDTIPFVVRGEVGYVRATLAPREQWVGAVPVLVVPDAWSYPYPRRRGLAWSAAPGAPLASADAMFSLNAVLGNPRRDGSAADDAARRRVVAWARANAAAAELEPARTLVRRAVLEPDWEAAARMPSRLRGSYRVRLEVGDERSTWYFRSYDRPGSQWRGADSLQSTAQLLASPHVFGYHLAGFATGARDSLPSESPRALVGASLVGLATTDRPTTPGNDDRRVLPGELVFALANVPERLWTDLETFVPRRIVGDGTLLARIDSTIQRGQRQARLPLTIELDGRGGVRADTTIDLGRGRTVRVMLERMDTLAMKRPF